LIIRSPSRPQADRIVAQPLNERSVISLTISGSAVFNVLAWTIVTLSLLSAAGQICRIFFGFDRMLGAVRFFNVGGEQNVPTFYSSAALMVSACLFGLVAKITQSDAATRRRWTILAGVFALLSLDETIEFHEIANFPLAFHQATGLPGQPGNKGGFWSSYWLMPALAFMTALGLYLLPLRTAIPAWLRNQLVLSAVVFVSGAVGMEMLAGQLRYVGGPSGGNQVLQGIEEFLEMGGVVLLIRALVAYLAEQRCDVQMRFVSSSRQSTPGR
jgi:hypothetical protein